MKKSIATAVCHAYWVLLLSLLFVGCIDTEPFQPPIGQTLTVPVVEYLSVAWLDKQTIIVLYQPTNVDESDGSSLERMAMYDMVTDEWTELPMPDRTTDCSPVASFVAFLTRLPNMNLGFTYTCLSSKGVSGSLYEWDHEENSLQLLHQYPIPFNPGAFAFSPNMKELIQGDAEGFGLNENLFQVSQDGDLQQLLSNFQRVREPSWSPDGTTVAFAGTEIYPGGDSSNFTQWGQIEGLLDYPWDIYLMDAEGNNIRIIFSGVHSPTRLRWLPDGQHLTFTGIIKGNEGIWLLNIEDSQLIQIWDEQTVYDFSPDGKQVIILDEEKLEGSDTQTHLVIVDLR